MFLCFFCFVGKCVSNEKKSIKDYFARGVYRILSKGEDLTFARAFKRISPGWGGRWGASSFFDRVRGGLERGVTQFSLLGRD